MKNFLGYQERLYFYCKSVYEYNHARMVTLHVEHKQPQQVMLHMKQYVEEGERGIKRSLTHIHLLLKVVIKIINGITQHHVFKVSTRA